MEAHLQLYMLWETWKRISIYPYWFAKIVNHPNANKYGYVLEHRVLMENKIGRLLENNEIVHHKNGDKRDNRIDNLELMTRRQHHQLHRMHPLVKLLCPQCNKHFYRKACDVRFKLKNNKSKTICCSRKCVIKHIPRVGSTKGRIATHYNQQVKKIIDEKWDGTMSRRQFAISYGLPISTVIRWVAKKEHVAEPVQLHQTFNLADNKSFVG